jgi:hypothetical protein
MLRLVSGLGRPGLPLEVPLYSILSSMALDNRALPYITIGRAGRGATVVMSSPGHLSMLLGRLQVKIMWDGEQFIVLDLNATNSSYVRAAQQQRTVRSITAKTDSPPQSGERYRNAALGHARAQRWRHYIPCWACQRALTSMAPAGVCR